MKTIVAWVFCLAAAVAGAASVTTGEELKAAIEAASETEPTVIEIGELDIYLLETVKLTKPITLRGRWHRQDGLAAQCVGRVNADA